MKHQKPNLKDQLSFYMVLAFVLISLIATPKAFSGVGDGPYLTLTGAINIYEDSDLIAASELLDPLARGWGSYLEIDSGLGFNHSIGYSFGRAFSMEVEFSSQEGKFNHACSNAGCEEGQREKLDGDIETKTLLVNAIHFFNSDEPFSPYIGYGIGTAFHEATLFDHEDGSQTTFAYQFKTGVELKLTPQVNLITGYRFLTTDKPDFGFFTIDVTTHSIEAGIKYNF